MLLNETNYRSLKLQEAKSNVMADLNKLLELITQTHSELQATSKKYLPQIISQLEANKKLSEEDKKSWIIAFTKDIPKNVLNPIIGPVKTFYNYLKSGTKAKPQTSESMNLNELFGFGIKIGKNDDNSSVDNTYHIYLKNLSKSIKEFQKQITKLGSKVISQLKTNQSLAGNMEKREEIQEEYQVVLEALETGIDHINDLLKSTGKVNAMKKSVGKAAGRAKDALKNASDSMSTSMLDAEEA